MTQEESNVLYKKYFRHESNKSITFIGTKLEIIIPEDFLKKNITYITNNNVETIGIFEGYIFDNEDEDDLAKCSHKYILKAPDMLFLNPSHIEKTTETVEDPINDVLVRETIYKFIFFQGDTYIMSTDSIENLDTSNAMLGMLLGSQLPKSLNYEDALFIWDKCNRRNKAKDLNVNFNTLAMIVSSVVRCPDNLTVPFRQRFENYYAKGIYNGKFIRVYDIPKYTSNYTSLTSADPKHGLTVAMERTRTEGAKDIVTPVEQAIS